MGWWAHLKDASRRRRTPPIALLLQAEGFTATDGTTDIATRWADINRITAFKRDLFSYDELCLLIHAGDRLIELNEEMTGYLEFDEALHEALAISPKWKLEVLFPAFATNAIMIFERSS